MGNSALLGSFERKTNSPIEAQYIFPTYQALVNFFTTHPEWKDNLHKGLLKVVEDDGNGNLVLYWVSPVNVKDPESELEFKPLLKGNDIGKLKTELQATVGTTEDDIVAYLDTLPEDFNNITKLVTQLKFFLVGKEPETDIINTWQELLAFLDGFKDTDRLYHVIEELRIILKQTLVGVGLASDGTYIPDQKTNYLEEATSVMNALRILDGVVKTVNKKYEVVNNDVVPLHVHDIDGVVSFGAMLKLSDEARNGLIKKNDGLYLKVNQDYNDGILTLYVNDSPVSMLPIASNFSGIQKVDYDGTKQQLTIRYILTEGGIKDVVIDIGDLNKPWVVENPSGKVVTLTKVIAATDRLSADVNLSSNTNNILVKSGSTLLVEGVTTNIKHSGTALNIVLNTINTNISSLQARVPDIDALMTKGTIRGSVIGFSNLASFNPPGLVAGDCCIVFDDESHDYADSLFRYDGTWSFVRSWVNNGGGGDVTVVDNLTSSSPTSALSANQGRVLKGLIDGGGGGVTVVDNLTSDSATDALSAKQGRVLKGLIDAGGFTVVDNLTSSSTTSALSANQGRVLDGLIDAESLRATEAESTLETSKLNKNFLSGHGDGLVLDITLAPTEENSVILTKRTLIAESGVENSYTTTIKGGSNVSIDVTGTTENPVIEISSSGGGGGGDVPVPGSAGLFLASKSGGLYDWKAGITAAELTTGTDTENKTISAKTLSEQYYSRSEVDELLQAYAQLAVENIFTAYQDFKAGAGVSGPDLRFKNKI